MPRPPELIPNVVFDEPFFNAVLKRTAGLRLSEITTIPPGVRNVDYAIGDFLIELKTLTTDPLDSAERQADIKEFLRSKLPATGALWITPTQRAVAFSSHLSNEYWERIMGKSMRNRLQEAAKQIRDTRTLVPGTWRGAVILVNTAGESFDWLTFSRLADKYQQSIPEIDALFALNGVPTRSNGKLATHFAIIAKTAHRSEADALGSRLDQAIREEIAFRTKHPLDSIETIEVDPNSGDMKATFQVTPTGVRKKRPQV